MRASFIAPLAIALLVASCQKDDDTPPSSGGGGNGVDTTGNNGTGLVVSWSPVRPYTDQEITFTGGPFSTNMAQNSVVSQSQAFTILSVTTTQLVAQPPPGWSANTGGFSTIFIQSGSAADTLYPVYWKRPFNVLHFEDNLDDWIFGAPSRPGDSVVFNCISATYEGMSVSINGQSMPGPFAVDSAFYCTIAFRIPVSMGVGSDESTTTNAFLTATNGDGSTDTLTIGWAPTPDMEIFGLELIGGGSTFDLGDMIGNGHVLNFRVYGKYLHNNQSWTLTGPSGTVGAWGTADYGTESFIVINPISLQAGYYVLSLNGTFHSYGFTLVD
jgi:hypothetical protein